MATFPEPDQTAMSRAGLADNDIPQPARDGLKALVGYNFQTHDYRLLHEFGPSRVRAVGIVERLMAG